MRLAGVELSPESNQTLRAAAGALSESEVRLRYQALLTAINKMAAICAPAEVAGYDECGYYMDALDSLAGEMQRLLDEPDAWERMERSA